MRYMTHPAPTLCNRSFSFGHGVMALREPPSLAWSGRTRKRHCPGDGCDGAQAGRSVAPNFSFIRAAITRQPKVYYPLTPMEQQETSAKRIPKVKLTLTKRTVDALQSEGKPWIAWDDKLTGFGVRVHPSGAKSFLVNYRAGNGGRKAPNKRVVVGRVGRVTPDQARRLGPVNTNEQVYGIIGGWNSRKLNTTASRPTCRFNAAT